MQVSNHRQQLTRNLFYVFFIVAFLVLKYFHKFSTTEDLLFLLKPINQIIEFFLGAQSLTLDDGAFLFPELEVIIDKSCSGFNFFILSFLMIAANGMKYFNAFIHKIGFIMFAVCAGYLLSILVTSARIITSILIEYKLQDIFSIDAKLAHQSIGILTNISFLIIIYLVLDHLLNKLTTHEKLA